MAKLKSFVKLDMKIPSLAMKYFVLTMRSLPLQNTRGMLSEVPTQLHVEIEKISCQDIVPTKMPSRLFS